MREEFAEINHPRQPVFMRGELRRQLAEYTKALEKTGSQKRFFLNADNNKGDEIAVMENGARIVLFTVKPERTREGIGYVLHDHVRGEKTAPLRVEEFFSALEYAMQDNLVAGQAIKNLIVREDKDLSDAKLGLESAIDVINEGYAKKAVLPLFYIRLESVPEKPGRKFFTVSRGADADNNGIRRDLFYISPTEQKTFSFWNAGTNRYMNITEYNESLQVRLADAIEEVIAAEAMDFRAWRKDQAWLNPQKKPSPEPSGRAPL